MAYFYHIASKDKFRVYIYIKTRDVLLKSPAFIYNSKNPRKLVDSVKGLLVLYTILNFDVKGTFKYLCDNGAFDFRKCKKCGWANAIKAAKASYKKEILVEKPGGKNVHSPSPEVCEEGSDNEEQKSLTSFLKQYQIKKAKLSEI